MWLSLKLCLVTPNVLRKLFFLYPMFSENLVPNIRSSPKVLWQLMFFLDNFVRHIWYSSKIGFVTNLHLMFWPLTIWLFVSDFLQQLGSCLMFSENVLYHIGCFPKMCFVISDVSRKFLSLYRRLNLRMSASQKQNDLNEFQPLRHDSSSIIWILSDQLRELVDTLSCGRVNLMHVLFS